MRRIPAGPATRIVGLLLAVMLAALGCGGHGNTTGPSTTGSGGSSGFDFGGNDPRTASAIGDSITLGELGLKTIGSRLVTRNNYPAILQGMLKGLDPAWRVVNRGVGGERAEQGARRIASVLAIDRPGFVLAMEGTNNATLGDDPAFIVASLESMVLQAQGNKSIPVVGTIPPNFRNDPTAHDVIDNANVMIRTMARVRGVVLAEIFDGMNDRFLFGLSPGTDPLHPNETGYSVMAGIWFNAMQQAIPGGARALRAKR